MSLTTKTRLCAVIGHPVRHSFSPAIHNAAYRALGVDLAYAAFDVAPDDLPGALEGMRTLGLRGFSVTIPHKEPALLLVDELDATARAAQAINTIVNHDGHLTGHTTDGAGAWRALAEGVGRPDDFSLDGRTVLLLGAGGASRSLACHFVLEHDPPAALYIAGRTPVRAEQLAADLHAAAPVTARGLPHTPEALADVMDEVDVVINCSPVGMHPHVDATPLPQELLQQAGSPIVFDTVYNPHETRLLREAAALGCPVVHGLPMLVYQAAVQVELFTGRTPPVDVMVTSLQQFMNERTA